MVFTNMHISLVPRPPPFYLPFAFTIIHGSGRPAKKRGRPGSIHHVSGREVDVGGRGRYSNINVLNLKVSFLQVKTSRLKSGARKRGRALEWMVLCVVLAVGPLPPYVHLAST